jgi:hypothetical protein
MSAKCIRKKTFEKLLSRKRITKEYNLAKKTAGWRGGGREGVGVIILESWSIQDQRIVSRHEELVLILFHKSQFTCFYLGIKKTARKPPMTLIQNRKPSMTTLILTQFFLLPSGNY